MVPLSRDASRIGGMPFGPTAAVAARTLLRYLPIDLIADDSCHALVALYPALSDRRRIGISNLARERAYVPI